MGKSFEITISGQVQGVGFRPFVYNLAQDFGLKGFVCNNESGVLVCVDADKEEALEFLRKILDGAPGSSYIQSHILKEVSFRKFTDFKIVSSTAEHQINIPLTPDFAICEDCKTEIRDPSNRRHNYAFTTCTRCGPRFSITTEFPFERAHTTIAPFKMCDFCQAEYSESTDRRFHSQTNSCANCGIQLKLTAANGKNIQSGQSGLVLKAAEHILEGKIVAIKNTNGYLLCCDANNPAAILRLRKAKKRPSKPFALLYPDLASVIKSFELNSAEQNALVSAVAPIVILNPKKKLKDLERDSIAPGLSHLGVMLPSSAILTLLMEVLKIPIVATSGNMHGSPIISEEKQATQVLSEVADYFLHHNLKISFPQDDSVLRFANDRKITLRRSRGLAPNFIRKEVRGAENILAMGAQLKSTFTFVPNSQTYISQYFGDLSNYDVLERYQECIDQFQVLFQAEPEQVLVDLHPNYQSTILGEDLSAKWSAAVTPIQHHKAHFASVLGEHMLFDSEDKILGVIWDGTGFGEDDNIWGGEFFSYHDRLMERIGHFEYFDWIASNKMAMEPRLSLLCALPEDQREIARDKFTETQWGVYGSLLSKNRLKTSSVGRLFDAVASLLGIKDKTSYEGEAAMMLEDYGLRYQGNEYIDFIEEADVSNIPTKKLIFNIHRAILEGYSIPRIASSFIHSLALLIFRVALRHDFKHIACSGGVFQNGLLVKKLDEFAEKQKIKLAFNRILSGNDENISFGQLSYYQNIKN